MGRLALAGMAALACVIRCVDNAREALSYPTVFLVNAPLQTVADMGVAGGARPSMRLPFEFYGRGLGARPSLPLRTSAIRASALPRRLRVRALY
jgi:hypothetical protein